jgi:mannosyltransferase
MSVQSTAITEANDVGHGLKKLPWDNIIFTLLLAGAVVSYLIVGLRKEHLWFDEIIVVTYANQSIVDLIISVARFDPHPPLYHLQVKLWSIGGSTDYWLLLNSVLWTVLTTCSIAQLRLREVSRFEGYFAGLLFGLMPGTVLYAHSLRPYAMETCLTVWLAIAVRWAIEDISRRRGRLIAVVAIELALLYSNAGAPVIVFCIASYGFLLLLERRAPPRELRRWFIAHAVVAVLAMPAVLNSAFRSMEHTKNPTLSDVFATVVNLYAGPVSADFTMYVGTIVLFLLFVTYGLAKRSTRSLTISLIVLPFILTWSISHLLRPIWLDRVLLFTMPFFAVVLVNGIVDLCRRVSILVPVPLGRGIAGIILAGLAISWCVMRFVDTEYFSKPTDYRAAAAVIDAGLRPGDAIYVPENFSFWGIARYLKGPYWGSPLAIQDPVTPNFSKFWHTLLAKLGPDWRKRLHLEPQNRMIVIRGSPMVIGWSQPIEIDRAERVWLVTSVTHDLDKIPPLDSFAEVSRREFDGLTVHLLVRSAN